MTTEAEIRLIAKDEASKAIQNVRDNLTKMEGTTNNASKAMGGLSSSLGSVAKIAAGFVLAQGLLKLPGIIAGTVGAASNLNESLTKIDAVFGENAQAVKDWANGSAKAFGQSKQQALEAAGTYGNLFQAFGVGREKSTEMSKSLVELAADLASFNNTSIDDALNALRSGLSGETEPLKRFGVAILQDRIEAEALSKGLLKTSVDATKLKAAQLSLTDALAKQKEVLKKHTSSSLEGQKAAQAVAKAQEALAAAQKGSTGELDAATKAQAIYSLIMKDTALAQGDFSRTSNGLANQQRIFAAQMKDFQAQLGTALLPLFVTLITLLNEQGFPAFKKIGDVVVATLTPALQKVSDLLPPLIEQGKRLWEEISKNKLVMDLLGGVLKGVIVGALAAVVISVGGFVAGIVAAAAPVIALVAVLGGLGVALQKAGVDFGAILSFLKDQIPVAVAFAQAEFAKLKQYFESDLKPALQNIATAFKAVVDFVRDNWGTIGPIVKAVVDQVLAYYKLLWSTFSNAIAIIVDLIQGDWAGAWKNAKELVGGFLEYFKESIGNIKTILSGVGKLALEGVGSLITVLWDAGTDLIKGLMRGIEEKAKELPGFIKDKVTDLLPGWFKDPLGIHSPSRVMIPIGMAIPEGFAKGIGDGVPKFMIPAIQKMTTQVMSVANQVMSMTNGITPPTVPYNGQSNETMVGGYANGQWYKGNDPKTGKDRYPIWNVVRFYKTGTSYVPADGLAYLHKGEAVIPANRNGQGPNLNISFAGANFYGSLDNRMLEQISAFIRDKALGGGFRGVFPNA